MKQNILLLLCLSMGCFFSFGCVKKQSNKEASPISQPAVKQTTPSQTKQQKATKPGTFAQSINKGLNLPMGKATQVNQLINKYRKRGQQPKYFGWIRGAGNEKPFQKELAKVLNPTQIEQWKHIHAAWFDHKTGNVAMPYDMKLTLGLNDETYYKFVEAFSKTKIAISNLPKNDSFAKNIYAENNKKQVELSKIFDKKTLNRYNTLLAKANKK